MPKQIINSRMEGIWKSKVTEKNGLDEVERDLKIKGIRSTHEIAR